MDQSDTGLALLLERVMRTVYERREQDALHPVQWAALRYFARAGRLTRTVTGLSRYLGITKGPASRTATRLVRRGYLVSQTGETDRRTAIFSLTEEGRRMLQHDPLLRLAAAISAFSADEKRSLADCLEALQLSLPDSAPPKPED